MPPTQLPATASKKALDHGPSVRETWMQFPNWPWLVQPQMLRPEAIWDEPVCVSVCVCVRLVKQLTDLADTVKYKLNQPLKPWRPLLSFLEGSCTSPGAKPVFKEKKENK